MRSAYGAEEMAIGGHPVTIVVDVANVMGSRPDGWWRDRAGAAVRLHADIARLAASGRAILPDQPGPTGETGSAGEATPPGFVMVLEGAAKAAAARIAPAEPGAADAPGAANAPGRSGAPGASGASGTPCTRHVRCARPGECARSGEWPGPANVPGASEIRVVQARGSGDDAIVAVVRELSGRRVVVTADRELRDRVAVAGAEILGPRWLLGLLRP